jgi:hypothetical protein
MLHGHVTSVNCSQQLWLFLINLSCAQNFVLVIDMWCSTLLFKKHEQHIVKVNQILLILSLIYYVFYPCWTQWMICYVDSWQGLICSSAIWTTEEKTTTQLPNRQRSLMRGAGLCILETSLARDPQFML